MIGKHVGMDKRLPGHAFDLSGERERDEILNWKFGVDLRKREIPTRECKHILC